MDTRYLDHSGRPENIMHDASSKDGAITGHVGGENKNVARDGYGQSGGAYFGFSKVDVNAGGSKGGLTSFTKGENGCGIERDGGLGAGKQHIGLQSGGNYGYVSEGNARFGFDPSVTHPSHFAGSYAPITSNPVPSCMKGGAVSVSHNIGSIKSFKQVHAFWATICPGAVALYHAHLEKLEAKHPQQVLFIIKEYTKAFQHEVNALSKKSKKGIKKELKGLKASMRKAGAMIKKIAPKGMKMHHMVEQRHINVVEAHLAKHKGTMKAHTQDKKTRKSGGKRHSTRRHKKRSHRRKTMKGGYTQFGANVPLTPAHAVAVDGGYKMGTPGAVLNKNCDNCVDNYNHFTGKGSETGVFDQDVKA